MSRLPRQFFALVLLVAIVAAGGWLRLSHLGFYSLIQEELNHLYVGHELTQGRPPALPSGQWYTRGIEYSRLVGFTRQHIASPEIAARLPSALLGTLCLLVMAAGTWVIAGPWPAVGATLLLAIYPDAVMQSRIGRFYMMQLLIGLLAFFGGWFLLDRRTALPKSAQWLGAAVVTAAFLVAAHIQVTALPTLLAWWICLAALGVRDVRRGGLGWRDSVPFQVAAALLVTFVALVLFDPTLMDRIVVRALSVPYWARVRDSSSFFYLRRLVGDFGPLIAFAPFAFAYVILRERRGDYLFVMFAVPVFIFSFVLPFNTERFMLLALPPLFVAVGIAAAAAGHAFYRVVSRWLERWPLPPRTRRGGAAIVVAIIVVLALNATRASHGVLRGYWRRLEPNWRAAGRILTQRADLAGLPVGATKSLPPRFYWGRIDFNIGRNFLEQWSFLPLGEAGVASGRVGSYIMLPIGSPDLYAGVPVLTTPASIREHFHAATGVVIGIDGQAQYYGMVDPALLNILRQEGEELCRRKCGSLWLYVWRFSERNSVRAVD